MWGKNGRRHSESKHSHPETSGMESGLGKSPTPQPYPHPLPHKAWKSSFPGKGPDWMASRQPVPGCQRGHPPPTRHTSFSPPPAPADAAVHTLDLLLFSVLSPSPSGRACSLAAWQEPAVSLWVPASHLISTQSPWVRVRPLRGSMPAKANLSPCIPQQGWPSQPVTPALQWAVPRQRGRSELAQQACRGWGSRDSVGWHKSKNNTGPSLQPVDTIISTMLGENRVRRRQLLWDPCLPRAVPLLCPGPGADSRGKIQQCSGLVF